MSSPLRTVFRQRIQYPLVGVQGHFNHIASRVKTRDFCLISNNCWGAEVYRELKVPYNTPFVGLFLYAPCYIKLLQNLDSYLAADLDFVDTSKYAFANEARLKHTYPLATLGTDVEIHFLHYASAAEARSKWSRRIERMNDKLFVEFSDRDGFEDGCLDAFDALDFPKKVFFGARQYANSPTAVQIKVARDRPSVMDGKALYRYSKKYFDLPGWLDG